MTEIVRCIRSEWHQVERRYAVDIDIDYLKHLAPNKSEEGIQKIFDQLKTGEVAIEELTDALYDEEEEGTCYDVDWEWIDEDDWWTMRKGGFDTTHSQEVVEK